jgi:hypothetical protein
MFSILFSIFLLFMTFCYWICPKTIIADKKEYVKFFSMFFAGYAALHGIAQLVFNIQCVANGYIELVFILALSPILFITHLFYPFKTLKRNQHLNFFLFFGSLLSACIGFSLHSLHLVICNFY